MSYRAAPDRYRRTAARIGKSKAITATARKLAVLLYRVLRQGLTIPQLSAADYDHQRRSHILRGLRRRAASLGLDLVDTSTGIVI